MPLSIERTRDAYRRHRAIHEAACRQEASWSELADLFADEATYQDPFFGPIRGRAAIREFLQRSMSGLEDWTFPILWVAVDEGRLLVLGGEDGSACHDSTEVLDLETGAFAPGPPMLARREGCAAVTVDL